MKTNTTVFAVLLASLGSAQIVSLPVTHGSIQVTEMETEVGQAERLQISRGDQSWSVDLRNLVRKYDCEAWWGSRDNSVCPGSRKTPCPTCPHRRVNTVAWDERHQRLYFAITTWQSW